MKIFSLWSIDVSRRISWAITASSPVRPALVLLRPTASRCRSGLGCVGPSTMASVAL